MSTKGVLVLQMFCRAQNLLNRLKLDINIRFGYRNWLKGSQDLSSPDCRAEGLVTFKRQTLSKKGCNAFPKSSRVNTTVEHFHKVCPDQNTDCGLTSTFLIQSDAFRVDVSSADTE